MRLIRSVALPPRTSVFLVNVMGRRADTTAFEVGVTGGAEEILIYEEPGHY